jgi:cadmium resistance protein CadD (predicted permease)
VVATVLLAVGLYATTNIDNFVVLVAFYSDRSYQPAQVTAGAFLGLAVIVGVSAGGAAAASAAPRAYVGLLGFVPLTLGIVKLVSLARGGRRADQAVAEVGRHRPLVVGAVTVGSGGDNIAVYVPVFAVRSFGDGLVIVAVFVVAAALWCAGAAAIARSAWTGRAMERVGHVVIPLVYLGLGISILVFSGTVGLLTGSG